MQRRTHQAWRDLIESWQTSNLTQKQFCTQHAIAYSGFHYWFKKFREEDAPSQEGLGFATVKIPTSHKKPVERQGSVQAELVLPDGRRVIFYQGVDVQFVRALLS